MHKEIELNKRKIEYVLKMSHRARNLRVTIHTDENVTVTAPEKMNTKTIEQFMLKKSDWIIEKIDYFKQFSGKVFLKSSQRDYVKFKKDALVLAQKRIEHFNTFYNFKFNKISIKNQKSRWGSCSKKGNLNFNYKIALIPPHQADYIIVHELCHLGQFNHSQKFWDLVSKTISDYVKIRKELHGYIS